METESIYNLLQFPKEVSPPAEEELTQGAVPKGAGGWAGAGGGSARPEPNRPRRVTAVPSRSSAEHLVPSSPSLSLPLYT